MKLKSIHSLIICLLLTSSLVAQNNTNQPEVKVLNYADLNGVQQLNKLELGVRLANQDAVRVNNFLRQSTTAQSEMINPFLQWELDIEATMTHTETGMVKVIPAFYYREYERDVTSNSWKDVGTFYPMRIRFAPPLVGSWTCSVSIKIKGKPAVVTSTIEYNVIKTSKKGYVSVHSNKRNLQLDGKIIFPVGLNFPSPTIGVNNYHTSSNGGADLFSPKETHKVTKLTEWMRYHNDIKAYKEQGGQFIRILQSGWSSLLEFEKKGNYFDRQPYAWEQDRLLEYCEENGVYIHFDLMQQEPFMSYGNYDMFDWDWSHYRADKSYFDQDIFPEYCYADGKNKQPYEALTLEEDLRFHEQRTRYYIARYGYSTSIYLFEILSEPWHIGEFSGTEEPFTINDELGKITREAVQKYHERLASYIKDSMQHTNQLVGIDMYTAKFYEGELFLDQSIYHPAIDVVSFNPYSSFPDKLIVAKSSSNNVVADNENSMARMVLTIGGKCGKPIMIGEGGAADGDEAAGYPQQYLDMMTFGFTGLAGYYSWVGWNTKQDFLWSSIINAQQFMNGSEVNATLSNGNGFWVQGRQAERNLNRDAKNGKETQYYISQDQLQAVGYVKNRSFNYFTKSTSQAELKTNFEKPFNELTDMSWDTGKPLIVEGLERNKTYQITWYDYKTGASILTECMKVKRGKFKLRFPELTVTAGKTERPALWFSMVQQECPE